MANNSVEVVFETIPEKIGEFRALLETKQTNAFEVAAIVVAALNVYPKDKSECIAILNLLRGPRALSPYDEQFLNDRFMDKD